MEIKVPGQIKVGAHNAKVVFTSNLKVDDGWKGCYNQRLGLIQVDPVGGADKDKTLMHEVVHMVDLNYECGLDEVNISRIANGITEFLQNNLGIAFSWADIPKKE